MYEICIEKQFHASHTLSLHDDFTEDQHAHDWHVQIHVAADKLDEFSLVMDFHQLQTITDQVIKPLAGRALNDLKAFKNINPSAENIARHIFDSLAPQLPQSVRLTRVDITEAPGCHASYIQRP